MTFFFANMLPASSDESFQYDARLVNIVANDLREALAVDPDNAAELVADHHLLDFGRRMQIYILNAAGDDVLDRRLPFAVNRVHQRTTFFSDEPLEIRDPRLLVRRDGLDSYTVVGYQRVYPMGSVLARPGARALLLIVAILVSAAVSLVLARFIVLPVRRLQKAGHRVAEGDLSVRVAHTVGGRRDDIAQLARDFDAMTERIERLLTTQQRLMRDVSHELRSPLARLQALQSLARQRLTDEDDTSVVDRMESESERLNLLIEEILSFARIDAQQEIQRQTTDIADLVQAIADDVSIEIGDAAKDVTYEGPERLTLDVDRREKFGALY
jgi:two-component system sensor histidine kinase CpxA